MTSEEIEIDEAYLKDFEEAIVEHDRQGEIVRVTGSLSPESGASLQRLSPFLSNPRQLALIAEIRRLRTLAFPPTEYRRSLDDGDDYCTVCSYAVDDEEHSYSQNCIHNLEQTSDYVYHHLLEENERIAKENSLLIEGFRRWKAGEIGTGEFEGLFRERAQAAQICSRGR